MALDFISILNPQADKKKKKKFKIDFTQLVTLPEPPVEEPEIQEEPKFDFGLLDIAPPSTGMMTTTPSIISPREEKKKKDFFSKVGGSIVEGIEIISEPFVDIPKSFVEEVVVPSFEETGRLLEKIKKGYQPTNDELFKNLSTKEKAKAFSKEYIKEITRLPQDFVMGVASGITGGLGHLERFGWDKAKPMADKMEEWTEQIASENPNIANTFINAVGSMSLFYVPGLGVAKGTSIIAGISPKIANLVGNSAMTFMESSMEAGNVYRDLKKQGYGEEEAKRNSDIDFGINVLLLALTNKFDFTGTIQKSLMQQLKNRFLTGGRELIQELGQQVAGNLTTYKDWDEGIKEAGLMGGLIGFLFGGGVNPNININIQTQKEILDLIDGAKTEPVKAVEPVKGEKSTIDFTEMMGQAEKTMETDQLISHEGAPDKKRVEEYKKKIQAGEAVEPLKIIKEDDKFGIEDGKHRFEAYKQLEYTKVPVEDVTKFKAIQFVSPNIKENLTFEDATKNLETPSYKNNLKIIEQSYVNDGLNGNIEEGRGDWADGAEEIFIKKIVDNIPNEQRIYALAKISKELKQKDAIDFVVDTNGKDELFIIEGKPVVELRDILNKNNIEFKTLGKDKLYVINSEEYFDNTMVDKMKKIAHTDNIDINKRVGNATFITGVEDRKSAQKIYNNIINNYEKKYGVQRRTESGLQGDTIHGKSVQRGRGAKIERKGKKTRKMPTDGIRYIGEKGSKDGLPDDVLKPAKTEKISDAGFVVPKKSKRKLSESKQGISSGSYYASKGDFAKMDIPKHVTHIEMPELIKLTKSLLDGAVPFIKKYPSAWGMFYADPLNPRIGINPSVFENLEDPTIAVKVLSHEIGHLIDYLPDANIKRGNLLNRLESLVKVRAGIFGDEAIIKQRRNLMNSINQLNRLEKTRTLTVDEIARRNKKINSFNEINEKLVFEKDMRDELKALTQFWKPFDPKANFNYTAYRYASPELYADFISVLFNRPDLAKIKAPKFHKRFFDFMEKKPSVKENYFKLMDFLTGKREDILDAREADIRKSFQTATELEIQRMSEGIGKTAKERASSLAHDMNKALVEKNIDLVQAVEKTIAEGKDISPDKDSAVLLEELDLIKNEVSNVFDKVEKIDSELLDNKLKDEDFSLYLFYKRITGDRATKANPFGATKESSQEGLDRMKEKLGKEKFSVLEQSAVNFNEIYQEEMEQGVKDGLYSQELFDELTKGDDIYATFRVLDYVLAGSVTPNMIKQIGTFKDIGQTYQATISKMVAIRVAANKNNFKKVSGEFFLDTFSQDETIKADIPEIKKADILKAKIDPRTGGAPKFKANKAGNILELITWRSEGKVKGVYVDPEIAKSFKYDTQMNTQFIRETVGLVNNEVFRKAYIDYSLRFLVRNPVRDLSQAWRALSMTDLQGTGAFKITFIEFVAGIKRAYPEARMFAKNVKTETIQQILDKKILGVDEDYKMIKEDMDESTALSREMRKRGLRLKQIQKDKISLNPFVHLGNFIMQVGKTSEAITKIMAYQVIEKQLNMRNTTMDKRTAQFIRNNIGTPNWRKGGTITPTTNVLAMFSNVQIQGYKRTWGKKGVMVDPKTRSGYMWRTAQINIIPKLIMFMGAAGLLGYDIEELFKRVSTYKMRNYLVIPLGLHNGKTVSITLPMDYDARLITAIMWTVLESIKEKEVDGAALWNLLFAEMPSLTNTLNIPFMWAEYWRGINPRDNWRGRDVLTDQEFKAGGFYSLKPMLKWSWNQVMGGILKVNVRDSVRQQTWLEKIARIGGINAFLDVGDYGLQEKIRKLQEPLEKEQAENLIEKNKNIIDHLRKFYKSGDSEKQIDKYITMAMREQFRGKAFTTAEEGNFRKSFMRAAVKSYNNAYMTALIYSNTINEQKVAIKEIKKSADKDTFYKIQALFLNSKLISIKTWEAALNEFIKEKEEK